MAMHPKGHERRKLNKHHDYAMSPLISILSRLLILDIVPRWTMTDHIRLAMREVSEFW